MFFFTLQKSHESTLQPSLGRPDREEELAKLCSQEEERHTKALGVITDYAHGTKEKLKKKKMAFLLDLSKIVKTLMQVMDSFIYPSEVTGRLDSI